MPPGNGPFTLLGPFLFWPLQPASPPPPINAFSIAAPGALLMEFLTRGFGGFGSIHTENAVCHGWSRAGLTFALMEAQGSSPRPWVYLSPIVGSA